MSQVPSDASSQAVASPDNSDALLKLHKMSTTAGLGSADYVAVNNLAVTAVLLGAASWLLWIFKEALLVVIPLAAITCAVVAIWQVSRSNGTQSGRILAVLGLLMALGAGALYGADRMKIASIKAAEADSVGQVILKFGEHAAAEEWEQAYGLFHEEFHNKFSLGQFTRFLKIATQNPTLGKFQGFEWNGRIDLVESGGGYGAVALLIFNFEKEQALSQPSAYLVKTPEGWRIIRSPDLFPDGPVIMPTGQ